MASIDDILDLMAARSAQALYPNGIGQPSAIGTLARVYVGWPVGQSLNEELRQGRVHVSVWPDPHEVSHVAHLREWREQCRAEKLVTAVVAGNGHEITFGGTPTPPQTVMVLVANPAKVTYAYAVQAGDTPTGIATALAALIPGASSLGSTLTLPATALCRVGIGVWGTEARELRWNERRVMLNVWAPTPTLRRSASDILDAHFAVLGRLSLPDGSVGHISYASSMTTDELSEHRLYRRALMFTWMYPTIERRDAPEIIVIEGGIEGSQFGENPFTKPYILGGTP